MFSFIRGWIKRHPRITYSIYLFVFVIFFLEVALRFVVRFNPSYYMSYTKPKPGLLMEFPYGIIKTNQDGFPDDEFEPVKKKPRVAYMGDSVCYGVGAGHGYRFTEVLEEMYPDIEHMNMSFGIGTCLKSNIDVLVRRARDYELNTVVYVMSMNDVLPDRQPGPASKGKSDASRVLGVRRYFDWLRGRSYLYTYMRLIAKNYFARRGYGVTNHREYHMFPDEFEQVFRDTSARINTANQRLQEEGVNFVVLMIPLEMQISNEAQDIYQSHGIQWDGDAFLDRGPQKKLLENLNVEKVVDGFYAFVDSQEAKKDISTTKVGQYFVYDKGDKLDWEHPNREGHRLIAEYIQHEDLLPGAARGLEQ